MRPKKKIKPKSLKEYTWFLFEFELLFKLKNDRPTWEGHFYAFYFEFIKGVKNKQRGVSLVFGGIIFLKS